MKDYKIMRKKLFKARQQVPHQTNEEVATND